MKNLFFLHLLLLSLLICSCSTSRVILLENNKANNAIVITTESGELVLDETNTYADISSTSAPAAIKKITPEELQQTYGALIASAPKPPINFLIYFEPGTAEVTTKSKQLFPEVKKAIKERLPCEVNIIGHADRTGSKKYNIDLSLKRAKRIQQWLSDQKLDISHISVESYGEEDPLIPTDDGVAEPRNRRVEILIR